MEFYAATEIENISDLKELPNGKIYAIVSRSNDLIELTVFPNKDWYLEGGVHFFGNDGDQTPLNALKMCNPGRRVMKDWLLWGHLIKKGSDCKWISSLNLMMSGAQQFVDYNPVHTKEKVFKNIIIHILQDEEKVEALFASLGISGWNSVGFSDSERIKLIRLMFKK